MPEGDMSTGSPWGPRKVRNRWMEGAQAAQKLASVLQVHITQDQSDKLPQVYRSTPLTGSGVIPQPSKNDFILVRARA